MASCLLSTTKYLRMSMKSQNGMREPEESSSKLVSESTNHAVAEHNNNDLEPSTNVPSSETIVIAIGASAGGVEALEELFTVIPERLGMAYVVVQHLSPNFKSLMPQILARKTGMPVLAIDEEMPLEANRVYVLPSGKGLTVSNRVLIPVDQSATKEVSKPIDDFFCALAEDVGESAIGVVLSGTCLLYTSPSPRDRQKSRMPSSA